MNHLIKWHNRIWLHYKGKMILSVVIFTVLAFIGAFYQLHHYAGNIKNPEISWEIYFYHNTFQFLILTAVGILTYGVASYILLILDGLIAGLAIGTLIKIHRLDLIWSAFLPHAIFEVPAVLFSTIIPYIVWRALLAWKKEKSTRALLEILKTDLLPTVTLVLILFLIAAIMESTFTI